MTRRTNIIIVWVGIFLYGILGLCYVRETNLVTAKAKLGKSVVLALYNFSSVEQLNEQMKDLRSMCTEDVYNQLTIDNEDRTLNTYLKFKNKATEVNIIKSTESYVLYSLDTDYISADRKFLFLFDVNKKGELCWVREEEGIDFINYD